MRLLGWIVPLVFVFLRTSYAQAPWRAHQALGLPSFLRFGLEHRLRFEHLQNEVLSTGEKSATALSLRTLLSVEVQLAPLFALAEVQDARAFATESTPLTNALINPLELLQGYAGLRMQGLFSKGDQASLTVGRFTLDLGSRRLVARNDFRNTINAFTGIDLRWTSKRGQTLRAFVVHPVQRLPTDAGDLAAEQIVYDRENTNAVLWSLFYGTGELPIVEKLEAYVLGLHERDGVFPTADRQLVTIGARLVRAPAASRFDGQAEGMAQFGTSRKSATQDARTDLAHRAGSVHLSAGYTWDLPLRPRLVGGYDFASGDVDPADEQSERFDPLFGARRFDFGPTGLYGALARSDLHSPSMRIEITSLPLLEGFFAYRPAFLARGDFVGHQLEARLRVVPFPRNLVVEAGAAYFDKVLTPLDPVYVYAQVTGFL